MDHSNRAGIITFVILVLIAGGATTFALTHRTAVTPSVPSGQVATSTHAQLPAAPIATSTPVGEQGMKVITAQDSGKAVSLAPNQRFILKLGSSLKWTLTFEPSSGITRVPNSTTTDGAQGVYEAGALGTVTLRAIGAPDCKPGMMCAEFLQEVEVTFIIS